MNWKEEIQLRKYRIEVLEEENRNLKCCGNCMNRESHEDEDLGGFVKEECCVNLNIPPIHSSSCCRHWEFDCRISSTRGINIPSVQQEAELNRNKYDKSGREI